MFGPCWGVGFVHCQREPDILTSLSSLSHSRSLARSLALSRISRWGFALSEAPGGPHSLHALALGRAGRKGRPVRLRARQKVGDMRAVRVCRTALSGLFGNEHLTGRRLVCLDIFAHVITLQKSKVLSPVQGGFPVLLIKLWNIEPG